VTLLLRKQRAQDRIEGREPLDWRDENYAIVDETKVGRIYTQRIHEEMKWLLSLQTLPAWSKYRDRILSMSRRLGSVATARERLLTSGCRSR
jgi:hypothetical protein